MASCIATVVCREPDRQLPQSMDEEPADERELREYMQDEPACKRQRRDDSNPMLTTESRPNSRADAATMEADATTSDSDMGSVEPCLLYTSPSPRDS